MMEKNVFAATETNVFGTWNVARAAIEHRVEDFCHDLHRQGGAANQHDGSDKTRCGVADSRTPDQLQRTAAGRGVANLVLRLKELIPDYNPGAQLLRSALSVKADHPVRAKAQILHGQAEVPALPKRAAAVQMN
jgi:hypothetical protein